MRPFALVRETDVTGISGTGTVAEGVEFQDGTVALRWLETATARADQGVRPTTVIHESIDSVVALHGHGRSSYVVFANGDRLYQDGTMGHEPLDDQDITQVHQVSVPDTGLADDEPRDVR